MKVEEVVKAKKAGALRVISIKDLITNEILYDYAWSHEEKDILKEEYSWDLSCEIIEQKLVRYK